MNREANSGKIGRKLGPAHSKKDNRLPDGIAELVVNLPGSVYMIPDELWGFHVPARQDHPGICTSSQPARWKAVMLLGRDPRSAWNFKDVYHVHPSLKNGLRKTTAFELIPRLLRLDLIAKMEPNRRLGMLDDHDAAAIRHAMERIFPSLD